jgi:predicted metal-dependent hydrolase
MTSVRDRDLGGRPEQARPRDRTGRPLPHDTDVVLRTEEHALATREEALVVGLRLWSAQRFFEAHECLEEVWHPAPEADREFWKGVIQVAVGCVHHQRGNAEGCVTLLRRAADYLAPYPSPHHGIRTDELRTAAHEMADTVAMHGAILLDYPQVRSTPDGPYVGAAPTDGPHPIEDRPAWRSVPRTAASQGPS